MSGDLFELLVALAIIFFGLLGGTRKKKRPPATHGQTARRTPSAERRGPAAEYSMGPGSPGAERRAPAADDSLGHGWPTAEPSAERRVPSTQERDAASREELFSELERILRGQPVERPAPPPEVPEPEEAYSLEQLDGESLDTESTDEDVEGRHDRFHEKYVAPLPSHPARDSALGPRRSAVVQRLPLQQAIIWREILGPPKGLE